MRPGYPKVLVDALMSLAGLVSGDCVYEVGSGTGKGTVELAGRGLEVLAIEPDPDMARLCRRHCASFPSVSVIETDFERWESSGPRKALVSFQAFHWVDPQLRYRLAHRAIRAGGTLAGVWSFPAWQRCLLRSRLALAYESAAPNMAPDFPMHPSSGPAALAGEWQAETLSEGLFENPGTRTFEWSQAYSSAGYVQLLQTHQDHILLETGSRDHLLTVIRDVIVAAGGTIDVPLTSYLCTAARSSEV
jgi:SAM-dependent methyltransferase